MEKKLIVSGLAIAISTGLFTFSNYLKPQNNSREIASTKMATMKLSSLKFKSAKDIEDYIVKNKLDQVEHYGRLIKEYIDLHTAGQYYERYLIESGNERTQIEVLNKSDVLPFIGKEVVITGWRDHSSGKVNGHVDLTTEEVVSKIPGGPGPRYVRHEKMLLVMADFLDSTPLPVGPEWVSTSTIGDFLNTKTFQDYFHEIYEGRVKNTVTKVVDFRFQRNCADKVLHVGNGSVPGYMDTADLETIFSELNLNPSDYQNVSILANCNSSSAWGMGSGSTVQGVYLTTSHLTMWPTYFKYGSAGHTVPYMPIPDEDWTFLDGFIHERLHTYGHPHANGLDCGDKPNLLGCTHREYQNPFDVMGSRTPGFYLNAHLMKRGNVRPERQFLKITAPGVYTIEALETSYKPGLIAAYIKVPQFAENVFMVEYRTPQNFDKNLERPEYKDIPRGLLLYSSISPGGWGQGFSFSEYTFRLVDPYPELYSTSNPVFIQRIKNRPIVPERPYYDPITGVKITVISTNQFSLSRPKPGVVNQAKKTITFRVDFDEPEIRCDIAKITEIVEPFRFVVNNQTYGPNDTVTLFPGDEFTINAVTHQVNPVACPKPSFDTVVNNTSMITSWTIPRGDGGWPELDMKDKPIPDDGGYSTPTIQYKIYENESIFSVSSRMRVPLDAPVGNFELPVTYRKSDDSEGFDSVLRFKIQSSRRLKLIK